MVNTLVELVRTPLKSSQASEMPVFGIYLRRDVERRGVEVVNQKAQHHKITRSQDQSKVLKCEDVKSQESSSREFPLHKLQRRGESRATINEELCGGLRSRAIHLPIRAHPEVRIQERFITS